MTKDKNNCIHDHNARMKQITDKERSRTIETVHGVKQDAFFSSYPKNMTIEEESSLRILIDKVTGWHRDRNLIEGSSDKDQTLKLLQELGELSDSICRSKDISDDIGDMLVVMINIAERNGLTLEHCLGRAWDDIKDRKGKMIDGIFVKQTDL
tara:strand:+ start:1049 stop:1507 length:459 start_codon:yes stop_codon:yes gene_type:complete